MTPVPTPDQAVHVLEILEEWTRRGFWYETIRSSLPTLPLPFTVYYTDPDDLDDGGTLESRGVNHFDAICQATTVMQVLLEEHPEKP